MGEDLVALLKCKQCGVRMFERDALAHLLRHGAMVDLDDNFERGTPDTFARPGAQAQTYGRVRLKGKRPGRIPQTDDEIEIIEDEPLASLEEIVES